MSTLINNLIVDYFKTIIKYDNENAGTKMYFLLSSEKILSAIIRALKFENKFPFRWKTPDFSMPYFDFKGFFYF